MTWPVRSRGWARNPPLAPMVEGGTGGGTDVGVAAGVGEDVGDAGREGSFGGVPVDDVGEAQAATESETVTTREGRSVRGMGGGPKAIAGSSSRSLGRPRR